MGTAGAGDSRRGRARRTTSATDGAKAAKRPAPKRSATTAGPRAESGGTETDDKTVLIRDPRAITALAHPARMDAIDYLYSGQEMTATELAKKTGVSPSAMSYHLRALAKWGVIVRSEAGGDARERRWRAAGESLQVRGRGDAPSPAATAAQAILLESMIGQLREALLAKLRSGGGFDQMVQYSTDMLVMNDAEFKQLMTDVVKLTEKYRGTRADPPEDAITMRWNVIALPMT